MQCTGPDVVLQATWVAELSKITPRLPPGLLRVMLGTTLVVLSYSLLNPVLAVRLQTSGASSTAIGLFAMLPFISVAALVPLVPQLFARVGVGHGQLGEHQLERGGRQPQLDPTMEHRQPPRAGHRLLRRRMRPRQRAA